MNQTDHVNQPVSGVIFHSNALRLEQLASYRVALTVWRDELVGFPLECGLPWYGDVVEEFKASNNSMIPASLLNSIASGIRKIYKQLNYWLSEEGESYDGVYREEFFKSGETWMKYFDQLVWRAEDYTLDYLKTCHNLLQSDRVCEDEKFVIACSYCLENRVKDLWPRASQKVKKSCGFFEFHTYTSSDVVAYWIDVMNNQFIDENHIFVLTRTLRKPWVLEYFWPHLSADHQFSMVFEAVSNADAISLKYLLSVLNETTLRKILKRKGSHFVKTLITTKKFRSLAMPFWKHVADVFDSRHFFELVVWWMLGYDSERGCFCWVCLCEDGVSLCRQIWTTAPQNLKEKVLNLLSTDSSEFKKAKISAHPGYRDKRLLKMVLSEATPQQKCRIWKDNWLLSCIHATKSDMNDMIEMCLEDTGERMEFKRGNMMKLANIQSYCFLLLDEFEFTKLNDFLIFCSIDPDTGAQLKRCLLRSYFLETPTSRVSAYFRRLDDFVSLINESFPNSEQNASFKKEFIESRMCLNEFVGWLYDGEFDMITQLVAAFLADEQHVREWKQEFRQYCLQCLSEGLFRKFEAAEWQSFMIWCLGSDEEVTEFKQSLDVDEVFRLFLNEANSCSLTDVRQLHVMFYKFSKWAWGR